MSESINRRRCVNRREWLAIAAPTAFGSLIRPTEASVATKNATHSGVPGFGQAKSVIVVFANGGQSQLETWDPKPHAPSEIRGEFAAIRTSVPGTLLSEHLPQVARLADKYTIVRSMSHSDLDHGSAFYLAMTGHYHRRRSSNPLPDPADSPTFGAVLKRVRPTQKFVHTAVHVNGPALVPINIGPGQFGGFLGRDFDPMVVGNVTAEPIVVPGLVPRLDLPQVRLQARQSLLDNIDRETRRLEHNQTLLNMNVLYRQAFSMLSNPRTRRAFDLQAEPKKVRDRYGRNRSGQACLLARRLVEAEVPLITVMFNHSNRGQDQKPSDTDVYGWDTHNDIFKALKVHLLPRFDLGFSALLEDLEARGLLDQTLVICMGEFGRAPLVALEPNFAGSTPGRKHWASVYSVVLAGAGVARGKVLGKSDSRAAYPASEKFGPWDLGATIFSALGIDPAAHYTDPTGRPILISEGQPIAGLYG